MKPELKGRVALVTGGSRGIGAAIARALGERGASVAVNYRRDEEAAADTVEQVRRLGGEAHAYRASVDDDDAVVAMVEAIAERQGDVDLLVNNAGIASRGLPVEKTDPEELLRVVRVHALAPHRICQLVLPGMKRKERGDIIMISSAATLHHAGNGAPYNMGKAALESLALTLSKEVRRHGIRVNIVAPGIVVTEMGDRLVQALAGVESMHEIGERMPFGRFCLPEDVANYVCFLVSDAGSYITGEKLTIWGGGGEVGGGITL